MNFQPCRLSKSRCRILKPVALIACSLLVVLLSPTLFASSKWPGYPFPFVSSVTPQAVSPESAQFTLKVYGANFISNSVVNWNGQARQTTFVSARELDAQILASDVAQPTAGYVTVTNTTPGGSLSTSASASALVEVHVPTATISAGEPYTYGGYFPSVVGDLTGGRILDLVTSNGYAELFALMGTGQGTLTQGPVATQYYFEDFGDTALGDVNGDGKLDLVYTQGNSHKSSYSHLQVELGNGDGSFTAGQVFGSFSIPPSQIVLGDFNQDGTLDVAIATGGDRYHVPIYFGNGDGTFGSTAAMQVPYYPFAMVEGDFNGDGILDLVTETDYEFTIHLGNGDGTFRPGQTLAPNNWRSVCVFGRPLLAADFNGDGILDLAFCNDTSIGVMIGNGDGTFQPTVFYSVGTAGTFTFTAGDFNSDGKTDLFVSHEGSGNAPVQFSLLLGNGDGTFAPRTLVPLQGEYINEGPFMTGDFNSDGLLDFILQPPIPTLAVYIQQ
jgi:hypothetical protein